ncbi:Similar to tr/A0YQ25/A0YQ25_9CYAN O-succinylbenzoic acid--CoA ligase [Microcystis aeruginosa PCC 9443]|uniref:Similar to tr/A0YQ25/A0YQ25_9CYAN O-succinylbenzoic acid--CoA ligase n=1 Tax=Microcystis aeruginosa PCC 9443 TaxID=1160281 RepID=I4FYN1_MICAE|nr:2-succinylbenzoate--CoA ligase [Microcystis aeruginosa]CCI00792.1 Similar to tr/A0YQ25/A0YQ25_9CYAN O-succinylbenzoic acid--CoA ligase [Microcystis aeruginosa PCC 9443]
MDDISKQLAYLSQKDWLYGYNNQKFYQLYQSYSRQFIAADNPRLTILLAEGNPIKFLAIFLAAVRVKSCLFLANPDWKTNEWQQVFSLLQPDYIFGENIKVFNYNSPPVNPLINSLMIPTGGTSGKIRFAIHNWLTLTASVKGFSEYFQVEQVNSFCLLPLYHVSGLMQFLRSFLTGGDFAVIPYHKIKQKRINNLNLQDYFISLVPTQLQFFLENDPRWLANFKTVLLGGSPAWPSLLEKAREYNISLSPTYGMTETASQIVTLKPEDFRRGNNSNGQLLPHAQIKINPDTQKIIIEAKSLFLGYYPHLNQVSYFETDDLGDFDESSYLYIIGRDSQKIITGGENVYPLEVETAIRKTNLVKDVVVLGLPDSRWGQVIVAFYVPVNSQIGQTIIQSQIKDKLVNYKLPKHWIKLPEIPKSPQGKINQTTLIKLAETFFTPSQTLDDT